MMRSVVTIVALLFQLYLLPSSSFTYPFPTMTRSSTRTTELSSSTGNNDEMMADETSDVRGKPEDGSHAELMYTLGVNLARQLGKFGFFF